MEGGAARQENLIALSRHAERFESSGYRGLFAFLTQLRRLMDAGQAPEVKLSGGSGGVQLMSIHKSKGLEFPIVFLCDLDHAFSRQDFDTPVLVHPTLGLGPRCIDLNRKIRYPTMARLAIEERLRRENLAEEQRVLYVAMTRPKEKLILVDAMYHAETRLRRLTAAAGCPVMPETVAEGKCFGDWLLLTLLCRPEAAPLRALSGAEVETLYTGEDRPWRVEIHDAEDFAAAPALRAAPVQQTGSGVTFSPELLTFTYPHRRETTLPAKLTATQLKGRALDHEIAEDAYHVPYIRPLTQPKFRRERQGTHSRRARYGDPSCIAVSEAAGYRCTRPGGAAAGGKPSDGGAGRGGGHSGAGAVPCNAPGGGAAPRPAGGAGIPLHGAHIRHRLRRRSGSGGSDFAAGRGGLLV